MTLRSDAKAFYDQSVGEVSGYITPSDAKSAIDATFDAIDAVTTVADTATTDIATINTAIANGTVVKRLTATQLSALSSGDKPNGLTVYNTTDSSLRTSDGTNFNVVMPIGAIIAYGGSTAPDGWHLCDGTTHGSSALQSVLGSTTTPDLRGRFVLGTSTTYAKGTTGGVTEVTLTYDQSGVPAHTHSASTASAGSHSHTFSGTTSNNGTHQHTSESAYGDGAWRDSPYYQYGQPGVKTVITDPAGDHNHTYSGTTEASGSHTHTVTVSSNTAANAAQAHTNMPPYYSLVYIIKKA